MSWMVVTMYEPQKHILALEFHDFFDEAYEIADNMVMNIRGVTDDMPDWYDNQKWTSDDGSLSVEICDINTYDEPQVLES